MKRGRNPKNDLKISQFENLKIKGAIHLQIFIILNPTFLSKLEDAMKAGDEARKKGKK